jgi:hypothetical protein
MADDEPDTASIADVDSDTVSEIADVDEDTSLKHVI